MARGEVRRRRGGPARDGVRGGGGGDLAWGSAAGEEQRRPELGGEKVDGQALQCSLGGGTRPSSSLQCPRFPTYGS
ncbi:unnamed protein product [Urochloa humidicola]